MVQGKVIDARYFKKDEHIGLKRKYLDFCDSQMNERTLWYLIPLISLSAAIMPAGIFLMSYFDWYIGFVGFSIILFFANIIISIAEQHTRVTITFYLITVLIHILAPVLSLIFFGL